MFEDDLEDDDLDAAETDDVSLDDLDEEVDGDEPVVVDADDEEDGGFVAAPVRKSKAVSQEDVLPSVEAKQKERDALAKAMEEFLARGGQIQEVDAP